MREREMALNALRIAQRGGADFAEIFMEDTESTVLSLSEGRIENAQTGRLFGAGVRVLCGTKAAYAYTNNWSPEGLAHAAEQAASALDGDAEDGEIPVFCTEFGSSIRAEVLPGKVPGKEKAGLIEQADRAARAVSPKIVQVSCGYSDMDQRVLVCNTEGLFARDRRIRIRLRVQAVASDGQQNQTGFEGPGAAMGFEVFRTTIDPETAARDAAVSAMVMLGARECPAGRFPAVIDSGFGGVIFHEACGHSLEATSVAKGASVFCGKLGEVIASPCVSAVDDGTLPGEWGSAAMDDEGNPTRRLLLIENGVLKNYLVDRLGGRRMGMAPTGCGRRQSYRFMPTSRMSNTYIMPGESDNEAIIASVPDGLYAKKMGGGSVNPVTGDFNFAVQEGYWIRNGKIEEPVRGATLIGKGAEILKNIDMVGRDLALGQGMCGSVSGSIPVNVGQPMIRVSSITVGGR